MYSISVVAVIVIAINLTTVISHPIAPAALTKPKKVISNVSFSPCSIDFADNSNVFVLAENGMITVYDSQGFYKIADVCLNMHYHDKCTAKLVVKNNKMYLSNPNQGAVYEYTTNGDFLGVRIKQNSPILPKSLAVDSDGKIYIGKHEAIMVYHKDGTQSHKITSKNHVVIFENFWLSLDSKSLYVLVQPENSVYIYDPNTGELKSRVFLPHSLSNKVTNIVFVGGNDKYIYLVTQFNIYIMDIAGKLMKEIYPETPQYMFYSLNDAAIAKDGTLWVVDKDMSLIYLYEFD